VVYCTVNVNVPEAVVVLDVPVTVTVVAPGATMTEFPEMAKLGPRMTVTNVALVAPVNPLDAADKL